MELFYVKKSFSTFDFLEEDIFYVFSYAFIVLGSFLRNVSAIKRWSVQPILAGSKTNF